MPELNQVYGIDLGTCNSAVARIDEFDQAVIVPNDINEPITPSVVYFESPDNVVVGIEAKSMAEIEPDRTVQFVKRFMGRKDEFGFEYNGRQYAPEEISAIILKALVEKASQNVGKTITDVVITVPAYFDDAQRMATKNAGQMAGLTVLDIVNEPIAAAIAYGVRAGKQKEKILVYDLGGGTFDVTVIEVSESGWRILVTGGRHLLGGVNWDDRLIIFIAQEFEREHGINPLTDPLAHQELRTKAEAAKKRLSAKTKDPLTFSFEGKKFRIELERAKFEEITADLLDESIQATRETLDDLEKKVGSRHVDRMFLVGGSSRMPQVKARVDVEFGTSSEIYDPDECVAKGAAIWAVKRKIDGLMEDVGGDKTAFAKALDKQIANAKNRQFYLSLPGKSGVNVSSHTYGIQAWLDGTPIIAPLLLKNQEIPYSHVSGENGTTPFGTSELNQATIEIILMETDSDSLDPEQCKEIGRGTVELPPGVPRGSEVKIYFDYAADGTMTLRAKEISTNCECVVSIDREGVLDAEEVQSGETHLQVLSAR